MGPPAGVGGRRGVQRAVLAGRSVHAVPGEAGAVLRTARIVRSAPLVAAAVADGSLPVAKAEVLAAVVNARTEASFVEDQRLLLGAVARLGVDEVRKLARWWQRRADQDGAEPVVPESELRCTTAHDGTVHLAGVLDPEGGAIVRTVLEGVADQLWRDRRGDGDGSGGRCGCRWPGCDRPPGWCEAHHLVWWEQDGRTDLDNLTHRQ